MGSKFRTPPTAQLSAFGTEAVSFSMDQDTFQKFINLPGVSQEAQNVVDRLRFAGFYIDLLIFNAGESMRVECHSIASRGRPF